MTLTQEIIKLEQRDLMGTIKKVMVLAGGCDQVALIKELRRQIHGVEIILIDMAHPVIATQYADKHLVVSTMDFDMVEKCAREEGVDMIVTACGDQPLITVATVSERLSLPCYLTKQQILNLTNKYYMKAMMIKHNIPTAKYIYLNKEDAISTQGLSFPVVVKPVDSNGSKGVKRAKDIEELEQYASEAFDFSPTSQIIVEEFKQGQEISIDAYVESGVAKILATTYSNKIAGTDSFTILNSCYPVLDKKYDNTILDIVQNIATSFELSDTPLLVQMIHNEEEFSVIEFSARMGGGSKYYLIERLSGVDIMAVYVSMLLGNAPKQVVPKRQVEYAKMNYVYCENGTFCGLENFDKLKNQGLITEYFKYRMEGAVMSKRSTSSDRVAGYLIEADSLEELNEKEQKAKQTLRVTDQSGNDIMFRD